MPRKTVNDRKTRHFFFFIRAAIPSLNICKIFLRPVFVDKVFSITFSIIDSSNKRSVFIIRYRIKRSDHCIDKWKNIAGIEWMFTTKYWHVMVNVVYLLIRIQNHTDKIRFYTRSFARIKLIIMYRPFILQSTYNSSLKIILT